MDKLIITAALVGAELTREQMPHLPILKRFVVPFLGWAGAVALHMAWNGGLTLTANWLGGDPDIIELVAVQALIVLVPAVLVLFFVARLSHRHELAILRRKAPHAADRLTQEVVAFVQRLRELGFVEGRNLLIEYRSAGGRVDRLPQLAVELAPAAEEGLHQAVARLGVDVVALAHIANADQQVRIRSVR